MLGMLNDVVGLGVGGESKDKRAVGLVVGVEAVTDWVGA